MRKTIAVFLAAGAALALSAGAGAGAAGDTRPGGKYVSEGNYFRCVLPEDWRRAGPFGQPASEKKVYGVEVTGAAGPDGLPPSISVKYYAKGNTLFRSPKEFIRIHSRPAAGLGLAGDTYSSTAAATLAGRAATAFERRRSAFAGPRQVEDKAIPVFERFILLPAGEGFYVLKYHSVLSEAKAGLPAFEAVAGSFEPLIR